MAAPAQARRRALLLSALAWPAVAVAGAEDSAAQAVARLRAIERNWGLRLGLCAIDTASGLELRHRENERFAFCSAFKAVLAAAILEAEPRLEAGLAMRMSYARDELVSYSPITSKYVETGMRVEELCAAAIQYSDNTAANLLLKLLGGPQALTAFARRIGDAEFRLDRWETALNSAIPGDPRDTTTPLAMARTLRALTLGAALSEPQRARLRAWMRGNTTGAARIRAAMPAEWQVEDKTGSGDYGVANDVGVVVPTGRAPVVLAIFTSRATPDAQPSNEAVAAAARVVVDWLG